MTRLLYVNIYLLSLALLLCGGCSDVGFHYRSGSTFISAEAPLEQAGVYVYANGAAPDVQAALEYIRKVEIYDATAEVWLPLQHPAKANRVHPEGQGFVAGGYLAPGEYTRLRLHCVDGGETRMYELANGIDRLDSGSRICMFLWGTPPAKPQSGNTWTWQLESQRTPISGDQLALLSADGAEVQIVRTDNLHTTAVLGLHERWVDWLLRPDEGIWGLGSASMTLRDRESWRVQDRLGLPLVQEAQEFTCVEPESFAANGVSSPTFFISDTGANRVVSISRDGGNQQIYAAGYAPKQIEQHSYAAAGGQESTLVFIAAADGLHTLFPRSGAQREFGGNWRINDIGAAESRVFLALKRVNEVRSYHLPQFSAGEYFVVPTEAQELLVLRNYLVVACASPGGGRLLWLSLRDMTRMGQMPLPFAVSDMRYSPTTRNIYLLSHDGEHLLQIDSIGRRIVAQADLPRRARELLLVERNAGG